MALPYSAIIAFLTLDKLPNIFAHLKIVQGLKFMSAEGRRLLLQYKPGLRLLLVSISIHILSILIVFVLSYGLHGTVSIIGITLVVPISTLLIALPISVAGWGVREGVMVIGLGYAGVLPEEALAISIGYGLCMLLISLPGLILWLSNKRP